MLTQKKSSFAENYSSSRVATLNKISLMQPSLAEPHFAFHMPLRLFSNSRRAMRTVDIYINTSQLSYIDLQALPGVIKKCIPTPCFFKNDLFIYNAKAWQCQIKVK